MWTEICQFLNAKNNLYPIGLGADSTVYRFNDYVVKVYRRPSSILDKDVVLPCEQALFYQEVTNRAARYAKEHQLTCNHYGKSVQVRVNPIVEMKYDPVAGHCIGISRYIEGASPEEMPFNPECYAGRDGRTRLIEDRKRAGFEDLSERLNNALGVKGINIFEANVKIVEDLFYITDLCATIRELHVAPLQ